MSESALGLLIPEAEDLVEPFRRRYDTSAAQGVPAHITLLYPFLPPEKLDGAALDELAAHFARFAAFTLQLVEPRRFPNLLYLAPEPAAPLLALIRRTAARYPDCPPYGGAIPLERVIPHLTVAEAENEAQLESIAFEFAGAAAGRLPIGVSIRQVALIDNRSGRWQTRHAFSLSGAGAHAASG